MLGIGNHYFELTAPCPGTIRRRPQHLSGAWAHLRSPSPAGPSCYSVQVFMVRAGGIDVRMACHSRGVQTPLTIHLTFRPPSPKCWDYSLHGQFVQSWGFNPGSGYARQEPYPLSDSSVLFPACRQGPLDGTDSAQGAKGHVTMLASYFVLVGSCFMLCDVVTTT